MDWITYLKQDPDALESFMETLKALQNRALRHMHEARAWEDVLQARGEKKFADHLVTFVTIADEEERQFLRYREERGNG